MRTLVGRKKRSLKVKPLISKDIVTNKDILITKDIFIKDFFSLKVFLLLLS